MSSLINKISDKLHSSKNTESTTTQAPGTGQEQTFSSQLRAGDADTNSSSNYGTSGSTSEYGADGQRKKGLGEKAKETVGLDPKDGRDPKDIGYNQSSSTTGYNQGSSSSYGTTGSTSEYGADGQRKKGLGEKAKEAVGLDPKDGRDPKDVGYNQSSSSYNTSGGGLGRSSEEHRGIDRQSERMGDLSVSNSERAHERSQHTAAPVVQERIHDQYNNVDRTRVEELHDRTQVSQTVQPIYDERTEGTQRTRQDHGLEVHEHGSAGLDSRTEAELAAKRQQLASEHRSTHDERTTERSSRPDVDVQSRTNTVEEVVPVLERDVYRPHEIEHNKRVVNIHHEAPQVSGTHTNQPISVREWEGQGHSVSGTTSSGLTGRRERSGSNSSSSSDEERYETFDGVRRKKGLGEKLKEKVGLDRKDGHGDPKDAAFNNNQSGQSSSTTGYNQGSSTNYNQGGSTTGYNQGSSSSYGNTGGVGSSTEYNADGQRKKGLAEKAKETVGLDPKDGRDPKDIGYNNNSSTYNQSAPVASSGSGATSYGQGSSSSTGYGQQQQGGYGGGQGVTGGYNSGATGYGNTSGSTTGANSGLAVEDDSTETHRKKGFGEKIKEKIGLDPKDGRDPKDGDFNTRA